METVLLQAFVEYRAGHDQQLHGLLPVAAALGQRLLDVAALLLTQVLLQCGGDRKLAMKQLDVSRSVFYDRLMEYGLG